MQKTSNYKMLKASCDVHVNMTHISAKSESRFVIFRVTLPEIFASLRLDETFFST